MWCHLAPMVYVVSLSKRESHLVSIFAISLVCHLALNDKYQFYSSLYYYCIMPEGSVWGVYCLKAISSSITQRHDKMYNDELKLLIFALLSDGNWKLKYFSHLDLLHIFKTNVHAFGHMTKWRLLIGCYLNRKWARRVIKPSLLIYSFIKPSKPVLDQSKTFKKDELAPIW